MNNPSLKPPLFSSRQEPFPFTCRGRGKLCCADQNVFISPPEAATITCHLEREGLTEEYPRNLWGKFIPGSSTGLAVLVLNFTAPAGEPSGPRYCPFLSPLPGSSSHGQCRVHLARPTACQLNPLGRAFDLQGQAERFTPLDCCTGFERAEPGEPPPPCYSLATEGLTVREWACQAIDPEMGIEKCRYVQVVKTCLQAAMHAQTRDKRNGQHSERAALILGAALLYRIPPAPADPAREHVAILEWLYELQRVTEQGRSLLGRLSYP